MNAERAIKVALKGAEHRIPVMFTGSHGIGKSEIIYFIGKHLGLDVEERRASQMTEGDLLGLPDRGENKNTTRFLPPDWYYKACNEPVVLFFDEVDRAMQGVRQGLMEITDSRKIFGNHLHPDTLIFSACNSGSGRDYQVGTFDPAELDRWIVINFTPTVEEWIGWAKVNSVNESIISFIQTNNEMLENKTNEYEPNTKYPSRRSWTRFSRCLENIDMNDIEFIRDLGSSMIGVNASFKFIEFIKDLQIDLNDMLNNDNVLERAIKSEYQVKVDIINQMKKSEKIKTKHFNDVNLSLEEVKRLVEFIKSLDDEPRFKVLSIMRGGLKTFITKNTDYNLVSDFMYLRTETDINLDEEK